MGSSTKYVIDFDCMIIESWMKYIKGLGLTGLLAYEWIMYATRLALTLQTSSMGTLNIFKWNILVEGQPFRVINGISFKGAASSMNGYQNHDPPCPDRGLTLSNLTKTNA